MLKEKFWELFSFNIYNEELCFILFKKKRKIAMKWRMRMKCMELNFH